LASLSDFTTFVARNAIYVAGGYSQPDYVPQSAVLKYDPATNTWTKVADLHQTRGDSASTVVSDKVFIVGGWTTNDSWTTITPLDSMEEFDPATNTMILREGDRLKPGRGDAAFCAIRGRLFVFGGENPSLNSLDEVEVLSLDHASPESSDWHFAGELPDDRFRLACASLHLNSIHVFGGQTFLAVDNQTTKLTTTVEVYEFMEQRVYENLETRLETAVFLSGTPVAARAINTASQVVQAMSRTPVRVGYRAVETSQAQVEFVGSNTGFIPQDQAYVGDAPLSRELYDIVRSKGHAMVQIPLALNPVLIVHNIKATGDVGVQLDACGLAKIFSGRNYTWKDVSLGGVDPSFANVQVMPRRLKDESSLTDIMIQYLTRACPAEFNRGGFMDVPIHSGPESLAVNGSITYSTASVIHPAFKYNIAALKNPSGKLVTPSTAAFEASLPASFRNASGDLSALDFLLASGDRAYPIVSPLFAYIRRDQTAIAQGGALLKAYLKYLLSPAGQAVFESFGHSELSSYWRGVGSAAVDQIRIAPDAVEFSLDQASPEPQFSLQTSRESRVSFDQAVLAATLAQLEALAKPKTGTTLLSDIDSESATAIAIAGLVIAVFGFLLACYAACKVSRVARDAPAPQGIDRRNTAEGAGYANTKYDRNDNIQVV